MLCSLSYDMSPVIMLWTCWWWWFSKVWLSSEWIPECGVRVLLPSQNLDYCNRCCGRLSRSYPSGLKHSFPRFWVHWLLIVHISILLLELLLARERCFTWSSTPSPRSSSHPIIGQCWVESPGPHASILDNSKKHPNYRDHCGGGQSFCCNCNNTSVHLLFQKALPSKPLVWKIPYQSISYQLGWNLTQYTTHTVTVTWVGEDPLIYSLSLQCYI